MVEKNAKTHLILDETWYLGFFEIVDYESDIKIHKFKMMGPILLHETLKIQLSRLLSVKPFQIFISNFEFSNVDLKFVISDPKNPDDLCFIKIERFFFCHLGNNSEIFYATRGIDQ